MWIQRMPLLVMVAGSAKGSSGVMGTAGPRRTGRTGRRGGRMTGTSGRSRAVPGDSSVSVVLPIPHDDILPEAFAVVREAGKRTLRMRHFDMQLVGGMVLHDGKIAEMRTGEGKTLVATLPAYLNALTGKGVHIVTVNVYLAKIGRAHV